jgi:hypothetical protein
MRQQSADVKGNEYSKPGAVTIGISAPLDKKIFAGSPPRRRSSTPVPGFRGSPRSV